MSIRNLKYLFEPKSIAVIGASNKPHSIGATVLRNLVIGGYAGPIMPVNPKYKKLAGLAVYSGVKELPSTPELAIICTPPTTIPKIIDELGARGTKAAIVLTAGVGEARNKNGIKISDQMLVAAKPYLLRILGPDCVGILTPTINLNASFAHAGALSGKLAFVSQSSAMVTGVLDWAKTRGIGFSKFVSLGDSADIDFGDVLDYLSRDASTQAILLYVETIKDARKFMSAARAAARSKPTLIIKAGRAPEAAKAATSHTGVLAGTDDVYDAAIRRAGMLRVFTTEDLFDAVETLARARAVTGDRLVILTNGGGPGVMATDTLIASEGKLPALSEKSLQQLNACLPVTWSHANPVDIGSDASAERYLESLDILLRETNTDAILFIHAPTALVSSADIAAAVAPLIKQASRNVLSCWLGAEAVAQARGIFSNAGIPTYDTPEKAVRGFMQMVQYNRNQQQLMEVPAAFSGNAMQDRNRARALVDQALSEGRTHLSEPEAKEVLAAYGIPVVQTRTADTQEEAARLAQEIGFPVALKILSPNIAHKSDVGGVVLDLENTQGVMDAASAMLRRVRELYPNSSIPRFAVQKMARHPQGRELIIGITTDPIFGPVILFGHGGIAVEVTGDHAIALPPLNMALAQDLISRTRVSRLLRAYRNLAAADIDAVYRALIQVSDLIIDIPEIIDMDINPLVADVDGVLALDARIGLSKATAKGVDRLAIRPYPVELEEWIMWHGKQILLRPIRPEDAPQHLVFFNALTVEDVQNRIFTTLRELQPSQLAAFTQIDYDRSMAFIATRIGTNGGPETLGVARGMADPDNFAAEFAVIVRSDIKGKGLGYLLMGKLIAYCKQRGMKELVGETLRNNTDLLRLVRNLGFETRRSPDGDTMLLKLDLQAKKN